MPICVAVKAMFSSAVAILRVVVSSTFEASMDYAFVLAFVAAGDIDFALRAKVAVLSFLLLDRESSRF